MVADVHSVRDIDPDESVNMSILLAFERTQAAPQSLCLNDAASNNMRLISVTLDTSHFERSTLNDFALTNMEDMVVTRDTSHLERSPLNAVALRNMPYISVTRDTSH